MSAERLPRSMDAILMGDLCDVFKPGDEFGERTIESNQEENFDMGCRRETGWPSFKGLGLKGGSPIPPNARRSSDLIVEDSIEQIVSDSSEHVAHGFKDDNDSSEDNIAFVAEVGYDSSENRIAHESEIASDSSDHNSAHESERVADSDNNIANVSSEPFAESFSDNNIADASSEPLAESLEMSCDDATSYTSSKPLPSILFLEAAKLPNVSWFWE